MEQTECSETSAYKIQTPGNYTKESIQLSEHGGSLKLRKLQANLPQNEAKQFEETLGRRAHKETIIYCLSDFRPYFLPVCRRSIVSIDAYYHNTAFQ
jgi:hypothetical protein